MKKLLASISILALLSACANQTPTQQQNSQAALSSLISGAVDYASGNDPAAAVNGIQAAGYFIRSLQSTPNAANPDAVVAAVTEGTVSTPAKASPQLTALGTMAASAVTTLTANGTPPNSANEQVASALDAAVEQIKSPSQASLPFDWFTARPFPTWHHAYGTHIDPAAFKRNQPVSQSGLINMKRNYPLRKITSILIPAADAFSRKNVLLECGHETWCSDSAQLKARCRKCFSDHAQWLRQLQLNKITRAEYQDMVKDEKVIAANALLRP